VQIQRSAEQQQSQVLALQKQLARLKSSHEQLLQQQRQEARLALLRGGRFLLHSADGSTQQVLLYLTTSMPAATSANSNSSSVCSSRSNSITAGQQQQQQQLLHIQQQLVQGAASSSSCLMLAALPSTAELQQATRRSSLAGAVAHATSWLHLRVDAEPATAAPAAADTMSAASTSGAAPSKRLGRQQRKQLAQGALESGQLQLDALPRLQVIPINSILGAQPGMLHSLQQQRGQVNGVAATPAAEVTAGSVAGGASAAGNASSGVVLDECLSLQFMATDGAAQALTLQVPAVGSGRSRDEWVSALKQLVPT
jgi:hypothetical protein